MGILDQFRNYAADYAEAAKQRETEAKRKLAELEIERAKVEAQRDSASGALKRLANYPVKIGVDYICPCCWVNNSKTATLRPVPSETRDDVFKCNQCHLEFPIENKPW